MKVFERPPNMFVRFRVMGGGLGFYHQVRPDKVNNMVYKPFL